MRWAVLPHMLHRRIRRCRRMDSSWSVDRTVPHRLLCGNFSPPAPCTAKKVLSGFITMCSPSLQANRSPVSWHTSLQRCSRRGPGRRARCSSPPTSTASTSTRILLSIASASATAKCFGKGRGRWQGCAPSQMSFARRMDCLSFQDRKQRRKDLGQESTAPPPKVRAGSSDS